MASGAVEQLANLLSNVLSSDPSIRQASEQTLLEAAKQSGYGIALVNLTLSQQYPYGLRQLAAVVLKKYVKEHWTEESKHFSPPAVTEGEKAAIRTALPGGLGDEIGKIQTAVGMAIATIAKWDCPDKWPNLLQDLIHVITERNNPNLVQGAVRCLSLFADELGDEQVLQMAPQLFPQLLVIVSRPQEYGPQLQRRSLSIVNEMLVMLSMVAGIHQQQVDALLQPMLQPWLEQIGAIVSAPIGAQDAGGWGVRMEALKILVQLVSSFAHLVQPYMPAVMAQAWGMFVACLPLYQRTVIEEDADETAGEVDSDGDSLDFAPVVIQLFEFLLALLGKRRYRGMLAPAIPELMHLTLGYMQMTAGQAESWARDANTYVADEEEDTFSVRTSGEILVGELLDTFEEDAASALGVAAHRRLQEAAAAKAAGDAGWWRLREATQLAVGSVACKLLEMAEDNEELGFKVPEFLESVLQQDLVTPTGCPFLTGRALWLAARLVEAIKPGEGALPYLQAAAAGIAIGNPAPIQVGACRLLAALCPKLQAATLRPHLQTLYNGLGALLGAMTEDTLHLVLETLTVVVRVDAEAAAAWEPQITPAVLAIWAANVTDPLLALDAQDVLEALADSPVVLPALQEHAVGPLGGIISAADAHPTTTVEGAIDVLCTILSPSTSAQAERVHGLLSGHIMGLLMTHTDPGILQSCIHYLRILIRIGGREVLAWGGASPEETLAALVGAVGRLLGPEVGDGILQYVAQLATALLRTLPAETGPAVPALLAAAVGKLAAAQDSPAIAWLLTLFAQLVHMNANLLIDLLAGMQRPGQAGSALELVLEVWVERQIEIRGVYEINLTTTALALLLACGHPALAAVQVKGRRADVEGAIRTRARAKQAAEQWIMVPAPVKMFELLAECLLEAQAQGRSKAGEDESSGDEWEDDAESAKDEQFGTKKLGLGLEDVVAGLDDNEFSGGGDAELRKEPLYNIDLAEFVAGQLRSLAGQHHSFFDTCCSQLNKPQLQAVQGVFAQGSGAGQA